MKNQNSLKKQKKSTKSILKKIFSMTIISSFCVMFLIGIFASLWVVSINSSLKFDEQSLKQINTNFYIFDSENSPLYESDNQVEKVSLDTLPDYIPASFLSIEDKKFYEHKGLNYKRILKALYNNIKSGSRAEGASTISQQLIKNTHLSSEKTITRKVKEMLLTKKMEKVLTKNEILETYLNAIYFGNGAYGLESASKTYFNKPAKMLTIAESATLAGIIKSPRKYSPIYEKEACLNRRNVVLNEMQKDKVITLDEYQKAVSEPLTLNLSTKKGQNFYEKAVIEEACKELNLSEKDLASKGYYIFTYLDKQAQNSLTNSINNDDFYQQNSFGNTADSAGIVIDNTTGGIIAFNGKSDYDIVNMKRSPGSSIKPILVYAPSLESGVISPITPILDEPTSFDGYKPQNVGGKYYGYISATQSVEKSLNIPAIKIMQVTGIEKCKEMAKNCGIEFDKNDKNYAIALGGMTSGTTVKQLANSYTPFAQNGAFLEAKFIRKICDKNGNVICKNNAQSHQVMSEETAYLMTEMLQSGVKKGTSSRLRDLPYELAGKTGTVGIKNTNLNSDVWSVAYTKNHTFGVWLGNSTGDKKYMLEGSNNGGTFCTSMLKQTISSFYDNSNKKAGTFEMPKGVVKVELDSQELENNHALMLADSNTPEIFKTTASFNEKYKPKLVAKSFSELKAVNLSAKVTDNKTKLSFNALPQVEYKIYRINDDEFKLIDTIKNEKGQVEITDDSLENDCFYTYYVEAVATNYASQTKSKRIRSNSVKVYNSSDETTSLFNNETIKQNKNLKKISKKFFGF